MKRLDPPIAMRTPLGLGDAYFLDASGPRVQWLVFIRRTGEGWFFRMPFVRLDNDISDGVGPASPIAVPRGLEPHVERYRCAGYLQAEGGPATSGAGGRGRQ